MKKKVVSVLLGISLVASLLVGCGSASEPAATEEPVAEEASAEEEPSAEEETEAEEPAAEGSAETAADATATEKASKNYTIAVMVKDSSSAFWRYVVAGAQEAAGDLGVTVNDFAPMEAQSLAEQMQEVEDAIQAKVDAICIAPVDSDGIVPAIEKANEAGIPVITINTRANGGEIETFVGIDNELAAEKIAEYMMEELGGKGKVLVIQGNPSGQTTVDRQKGYDTIIAKYPDIEEEISDPSNFKRDEAMSIMENQIQKDPEIDAVIGMNDDIGLGAWQALDDAGLADGVKISGFDGAVEGCNAILDGKLVATVDQDALGTGYQGVKAAVDILEGGTVDEWIKIGGNVINADNAQSYLDNFAAHGFTE